MRRHLFLFDSVTGKFRRNVIISILFSARWFFVFATVEEYRLAIYGIFGLVVLGAALRGSTSVIDLKNFRVEVRIDKKK